ncbi:MAG: DNA polymerase I [Candidatus Kerfeldbacteria bacterium]|nr:DNA polymerase I [Candidatus Kerfeldbacteria bacterium]
MPQSEKFVVFDGNALLHRAFHALPPLTTSEGLLVNAVYGFTTIFLRVLKELKPQYVAVTFDRREPTFRHKAFAAYKAQRLRQPQELYDQLALIKEVVRAFRVPIFEVAGFEADDLIGTLCLRIRQEQATVECVIVTGDLDTLQLVDPKTSVFTLKRGVNDTIIYNEAAVAERYGLKPAQLVDYKALRGDPSDNIPGVRGIGEKTALELIKTFGSLEALYAAVKQGSGKVKHFSAKVRELLYSSEAEARLSKELVTIVRKVDFDFDLAQCRLRSFDYERLVALFHKLGFKSLLSRLPELQQKLALSPAPPTVKSRNKSESVNYQLVTQPAELESLVKKIKNKSFLAFDTETTSLDPQAGQLVGISLSWQPGEAYFIQASEGLRQAKAWLELAKILAQPQIKKGGHNLKYDVEVLQRAGLVVAGLEFDTLVAAYLLRSGGERNLDLKSLAFQEFGVQLTGIEELIGKSGKNQKTMAEVPIEQVAAYAGADADYTLRLKDKFEPELAEAGLSKLFHDIEMPLVPVLVQMELAGVKIDSAYLNKMGRELRAVLKKLEKKIHKLAGREFNINSPKQLKEVLFHELGVSPEGLRRTKTGISTAASELEKMRGLHPMIDDLFNWRELSKLLSTYVEALPELVNKGTGRVHTSFNQTVTTTGRLSSSEPNLQNIPVRGEWGPRVRQAFIADKGFKLMSADYSQIELRIVAHLAQDEKMIDVFQRGDDIHASTAAFIFGVKAQDVTPDQRRSAKEVNFGVLYGMGAFGLSERTGISRPEASDFIARYFETFTGVATWIARTKIKAREFGYVTTLFGRKRNLPEVNSGVAQVRNAAERMAVNLPTQGTAADLMKVAMVRVAAELPKVSPKSRLILQVHDELVFEVPEADLAEVAKLAKHEMEQAIKLDVPIVVDVKAGKNWGEMEEISH